MEEKKKSEKREKMIVKDKKIDGNIRSYSSHWICPVLVLPKLGSFHSTSWLWGNSCRNFFCTEICIGGGFKPNSSFLDLPDCLLDCLYLYLQKEPLNIQNSLG